MTVITYQVMTVICHTTKCHFFSAAVILYKFADYKITVYLLFSLSCLHKVVYRVNLTSHAAAGVPGEIID